MGLFFQLLLVILGQLTGLLHGLELIHGIAADVTDGDLGLLALLLDFLGQLLAALLGGCGKDQADDLAVMDSTAATLCRDNGLPILVFDLGKPANISKALQGEVVGTLVKE